MQSSSPEKTIVVLGATGTQGRGVVRALLSHPSLSTFQIRALTRDPSSPSSTRLLSTLQTPDQRLTLHAADVFSPPSLTAAFSDAYGLFAVTSEWRAGTPCLLESDLQAELESGNNIVDAAKETGVEHVVFSSLKSVKEASGGRFGRVWHFEHKAMVWEIMRRELRNVTALLPAYFYTNLDWARYCRRKEDGTIRFCAPVPGDVWADWLDPEVDIGVFTAAIFAKGPELTRNKSYPISGSHLPFSDLPKIYTEITGRPAVHEPITLTEWRSGVPPGFGEDLAQMMQWTAVSPKEKIALGTVEKGDDKSWEDLGVRATGFREWALRTGWVPKGESG